MSRIHKILHHTILVSILAVFILLICFHSALAEEQEKESENDDIEQLYEKLNKLEIDCSKAAKLNNFSLKKDIFEWKFESGYLYLTKPIQEFPKMGGAYFIGKGQMIFNPPNKIEKAELKRYTKKEHLNEPFQEAYIRFNDDTRAIFEPLMAAVTAADKEASDKFKSRQRALEGLNFSLDFPIIMGFYNNAFKDEYLFVEADLEGIGLLGCVYNDYAVEELLLFKREKLGFGATAFENLICQFNKKEDYESGIDLDTEDKDTLTVNHYDMDLTIEPTTLLMHAKVSVQFEPRLENLSIAWLNLIYDSERPDKLIQELKITDEQKNELPFLYKNGSVLVQLPKAFKKGEKIYLHFDYKADFIRPDQIVNLPPGARLDGSLDFLPQGESTFTLLNTYPWFPQYGYLKRYTFDLTIRVPKPFYAIASGTTLKRWEDGPYNCLHSKEDIPVLLASVLFGKYYTIKDDSKRPTIYVHSLFKQQRQAEVILQESRTIIDEYENYLGPFPYDELDVAQMGFNYGFGQAPPGLVQLTGEAFLGANELEALPWDLPMKADDLRSGFLSHEIGHEWWAHVVGWKSYHDQWLSESFTEYLAGLYLEATKGQKEFEYKLDRWKRWADDKKDFGPIWLGGRLQAGYFAGLYFKGPYVLHMFRMALIASLGFDEGNQVFFDCLKNFCTKFRHQNPTTKDFQNVVKETAKIDMDWFFDQWFRDAGIPKLRFSYNVRQTEDGNYLVEGKIEQEDKEHVKVLVIPIFLHFPGDKVHEMKPKFMQEAVLDFKAKVPEKPELVSIDDRGDLLAEIVYE